MGKKKEKVPTVKELETELLSDYSRWKEIYQNGCKDPFYEDGTNLYLVRNHIQHSKRRCEEVLGDKLVLYPDCYFFPLPIEVSFTFMAVDRAFPSKEVLTSTKEVPYSEALMFNWNEVFEEVS